MPTGRNGTYTSEVRSFRPRPVTRRDRCPSRVGSGPYLSSVADTWTPGPFGYLPRRGRGLRVGPGPIPKSSTTDVTRARRGRTRSGPVGYRVEGPTTSLQENNRLVSSKLDPGIESGVTLPDLGRSVGPPHGGSFLSVSLREVPTSSG